MSRRNYKIIILLLVVGATWRFVDSQADVKVPDPSCRLTESGTFSTFIQQSFNVNILAPCNVGFHTGPKINVPQFTAMFDQDDYQSFININSPIGTDLFTASFIINSSVIIGYLSFDIVDNMMVGESVSGSDFLINGTTPPVVISPSFESMYQLTISAGREFTASDQMRGNITFNLHSFVNTTNGDIIMALASVALRVTDPCDACPINSTCEQQSDGSALCIDVCQNVTCLNNGTCVEVNNNFTCQCAPGYEGRLCANVTNECDPDPCDNGGTCLDLTNDYMCECSLGFTGQNCSTVIDNCSPSPCENGGTCINLLNNYTCECPMGYTGRMCSSEVPQFTAMFAQDEYQSFININSPAGTGLFTTSFIINSSVTIGYLSFDIVDNMMVGESVSGSDFLINGTTPPVVISPPFESMYQLTISTGREFTASDQMRGNITFNLHSFVNTTNGDMVMTLASAVLRVTDPCDACPINSTCDRQSDGSALCINRCQNVTCLNNGTCVEVNSNFTCQCAPGYEGRLCANFTNECDPDPCVNGGICIDQHLNYTCNCQPDFTGRNCSDTIDDCMSDPCQNNATCIDGSANYTCICPDGLTGNNCESDITDCSPDSCENGGTCIDLVNDYMCQCTSGFTGRNCSSVVPQFTAMFDQDEYLSLISVNSPIGSDLFTAFFIINSSVTIGYLSFDIVDNMMVGESVSGSDFLINGTTPPVVISSPFESMYQLIISTGRVFTVSDQMRDNITFNLHSFVNTTNGDIIMALSSVALRVTDPCDACPINSTCEQQSDGSALCIDVCQNVTCLNNGTCVEVNNNFTCQCAPGYEGRLCANVTNECDPDPCVNGGICIDQHLDYTCNCQPDFTGRNCSDTIDDCMSDPCQNNATCIDGSANYTCICPDGLTGNNCESDITDCSPDSCENGGTCIDLVNDYMCQCTSGFTGSNCSSVVPQFAAMFDQDEYQSIININSPIGTDLFAAFFIINSSVVFSYLSFDIVDNMMVGESVSGSDFLINGTTPPVVISPPFESMYQLTISTGRVFTVSDQMRDNITFNLHSFVNTTNGDIIMALASVVLRVTDIDDCQNVTCLNNGTCVEVNNNFTCQCTPGYEGRLCANVTNECDPDPCVNRGICIDQHLNYTCNCQPDFTGRNCSDTIDDCMSDPCQNNATCIDGNASYTCVCLEGFNGTNCETNINDCFPGLCENGATCMDLVNNYTCDCVTGFTGRNCSIDNIDNCSNITCNNGTCIDLVDDFMCQCDAGFTGRFCETDIDDCENITCLNDGTCVDLVNNYTCGCISGYTGTNCSIDIDDCSPNPCNNNGTCMDLVNNYTCDCVTGFTGRDCSIDNIDTCRNVTCNNGTCVDLVDDFMCQCDAGYTGELCEADIDDCENITCLNNGTCVDLFNNYTCSCTPGFTDMVCSTDIDDCDPNLCENNGTCVDLVNDYNCNCTIGFTGDSCNTTDYCNPNPCENNATCSNILDNYMCNCTMGYIGRNCATIDLCGTNPCRFGSCTNIVGGYICSCNQGFTGRNCSTNIDDCDPNPCENNGSCEADIDEYRCQCMPGYTGQNCTSEVAGCSLDTDVWGIAWPFTTAGSSATYQCYMSQATRRCSEDSKWQLSDVMMCESQSFKTLETKMQNNNQPNTTTLIAYADELKTTTSGGQPILPQDVLTANEILDALINSVLNFNGISELDILMIANNVADTLNNLLNSSNDISFQQFENASAGELLLMNSKRTALLLAQYLDTISTTNEPSNYTMERSNIVIDVKLPTEMQLNEIDDVEFPGNTRLFSTNLDDKFQIKIPSSIVLAQFANEGKRVPVINVISDNINSRLSNDMSGTPEGLNLCSQISTNLTRRLQFVNDTQVTMEFNIGRLFNNTVTPQCVFRDYDQDGKGRWSTDGVTTGQLQDNGYIQCKSTHLTSFAVLVGPNTTNTTGRPLSPADEDTLSFAVYIGCGITIICLILTIVILIVLGRKVFDQIQDFIHFNISLAILLGLFMFVFGVEVAKDDDVACMVLGIILHYALTAAFCWILCDGILIYIYIYHSFYDGFFRTWKFFIILGWGFPMAIVGITIGVFSPDDYEAKRGCWLSETDHAIWGFIVPVVIIFLLNFIFLSVAFYKVCYTGIYHLTEKQGRRHIKGRYMVKTQACILPLVTVTWIIGLFAVNKNDDVYTYVFTALVIIQGFAIFLLYIILAPKFTVFRKGGSSEEQEIAYSYSYSAGSSGTRATLKQRKAEEPKKFTELTRRNSLADYNMSIRNEYTSKSETDSASKKKVTINTDQNEKIPTDEDDEKKDDHVQQDFSVALSNIIEDAEL